MTENDSNTETMIQAAGKTAPRVTPQAISDNIASTHYFTAQQGAIGNNGNGEYAGDWEVPISIEALGLLTFCVLVLRNGFTVTGESACASPENFDAEIGRKVALENAKQKIWPLMGYALKQELHEAK